MAIPHISIYPGLGDDHVEAIRQALQGWATVSADQEPPLETVYWITPKATDEQLKLPNLKGIIVPWSGVPQALGEVMVLHPKIALYNIHHNARAAAEMAVGLLIAAARAIVDGDRQIRLGHWYGRMDDRQGVNLFDKRAVILGYGEIGRQIGAVLRALGMEVIGVRRNPSPGEYGIGDLDEQLARSQVLVICAPLTRETTGLIDRRRLRLLKPPRLLVNVGRGMIVDEAAFFEACADGTIVGAGIDTWYQYPKEGDKIVWPSKYPFHELSNVVLSPHRAGDGDGIESLRLEALKELLKNLIEGNPVQRVDLKAGY